MTFRKTTLVLMLGLVWGCSSSGGSGGGNPNGNVAPGGGGTTIASFCSAACSKVEQCDSTADTSTCTASCQNSYAVIGPKLRPEFVAGMSNCFTNKDCATVLSGDADAACADEAAAALAPSAAGTAFCDALQSAANQCGGSSDKASCLAAVKQFSDPALQAAQTCTGKACTEIDSCIEAQLGLSSGGSSSSGSNSCEWAFDGYCDEPEYCAPGTDTYDCGYG